MHLKETWSFLRWKLSRKKTIRKLLENSIGLYIGHLWKMLFDELHIFLNAWNDTLMCKICKFPFKKSILNEIILHDSKIPSTFEEMDFYD